jgi:tripartite-type tricarboxylate transporter receptor subunit TctC
MRYATRTICTIAALAALCAGTPGASAQSYPTRPVTIVVPFPPGGGSDVVARIVADPIAADLGQTVLVENVSGAGGTTGTTRVANAAPDGYTMILAHTGTHAAAVPMYSNLKYHPLNDFSAIGLINTNPIIVTARKSMPAATLKDLIAHLKATPTATNAHAGTGSVSHTTCVYFQAEAGIKTNAVAYRGAGPAMNDLVGGHVDYMCDQISTVLPQLVAGTIKGYAVAQARRVAQLPDLPTAAEAGLPGYEATIWNALLFPKGTPDAIVARMTKALGAALDNPAIKKRFADNGGEVADATMRTPAGLRGLIGSEIDKWTKILRAANVKAD